jgi:AcrR family transcriptional regulator
MCTLRHLRREVGEDEGVEDERERQHEQSMADASSHMALVGAVARVAAREGYEAATPVTVAREAGVSEDAFWEHFDSVEQCYLAMYEQTVRRLTDEVDRAVGDYRQDPDACQQKLDAGFGAALRFLASRPVLARACVVEVMAAGDRARERRDLALGHFTRCLELLRRAHAESVPRLAPEMIVRGTYGLIQARVARGETEQLERLLPDLRYVWMVPFVGRQGAAVRRGAQEERNRFRAM